MTELYRLRSIDRLLGDSQELENQAIYFASSEELNDPMEGFLDVFWQGDRIVWTNLFRHYLYCLHMTCVHFRIVGESTKLRPQDIPVWGYMDQQPPPEAVNLFEDICVRVFKKANLNECIAKIVNAKRKARRDEVLFYLQRLHHIALQEIQDAYIEHGLESSDKKRKKFPSVFRHVHKMLDLMPKIEEEKFLEVVFKIGSGAMEDIFLGYKYSAWLESKRSTFEDNRQLLIFDFPRAYLKQLERLLYPDWYVACFMRDYRNSSVWGNYGDKHKGICLIFEAETTDEKTCLTLNQITGWSTNRNIDDGAYREHWGPVTMPFQEVNYIEKAGEIDFFRSIGSLPKPMLQKLWYSDKEGNTSECGAHLGTDSEDAWQKKYWDTFSRDITVKTRDWEYEQESRLILHSSLSDLSEERRRKLTYNFSSLKGIIFGIRTSDADKLKIMETIFKKCQANDRTDFEFFQAYYCHETGRIQKNKLPLQFSVGATEQLINDASAPQGSATI